MDRLTLRILGMYLQMAWSPSTRTLDLRAMQRAEDLQELSPDLNTRSFCGKLAECIAHGRPWAQALDNISLADNGITSLRCLAQALGQWDVQVQSLDLGGNAVSDLAEVWLDLWCVWCRACDGLWWPWGSGYCCRRRGWFGVGGSEANKKYVYLISASNFRPVY